LRKIKKIKRGLKEKVSAYHIRRARIWLEEIGIQVGSTVQLNKRGNLFLPCTIQIGNDVVHFAFPLTKLGRRYLRELSKHLLKGITTGTVKEEDVRMFFLFLAPFPVIYKYRTRLRKVTGLVRNRKLRSWMIWRRIKAREIIKQETAILK